MIIQLPPVDPCHVGLGVRLRAVREARGLGLDELARTAELSSADLSLAEHGRIRLTASQLHRLIGALRISLGLLFAPQVDLTQMRRF